MFKVSVCILFSQIVIYLWKTKFDTQTKPWYFFQVYIDVCEAENVLSAPS